MWMSAGGVWSPPLPPRRGRAGVRPPLGRLRGGIPNKNSWTPAGRSGGWPGAAPLPAGGRGGGRAPPSPAHVDEAFGLLDGLWWQLCMAWHGMGRNLPPFSPRGEGSGLRRGGQPPTGGGGGGGAWGAVEGHAAPPLPPRHGRWAAAEGGGGGASAPPPHNPPQPPFDWDPPRAVYVVGRGGGAGGAEGALRPMAGAHDAPPPCCHGGRPVIG